MKEFDFFSLALDESTYVQDTVQLLIFIKLAALQSVKGTTMREDIFNKVCETMEELALDWAKLASITTDGAPCMVGASRGLIGRMNREMEELGSHRPTMMLKWDSVMKVVVSCINFIRANGLKHRQFQQFLSELESAYGDALYYTEVRWLSRGRVLKHFYELLPKINAFLHSKGKTVPELIDPEWKWHLSFLTDLTEMLNGLNLQLQDQGKLIFDMYSHIKAFKVKLALLLEQVKKHNFTHLPATQNLFAKNPALAELQNCDVLKDAFKPNSLIDFYAALPNDTYPNIKKHTMKMSTLFSSTYICEQTFSRMKLLKTLMRSRLTDEHLDQCLRLAVTRMNPDIQLLTGQMQAHSSH
ncbi:KRAB domain-containing zinc finger protein [Sarotherodon galilaeus]